MMDMTASGVGVKIEGNTYPVRDQLRALGCRWSPSAKCWMAPPSVAEQAKALVPAGPARKSGGRAPRTCKDCGCKINYGVYCGKCEYR